MKRISLITLVLVTASCQTLSQWTQTGPTGGWIVGMTQKNADMYAATDYGGVYHFDGTAWVPRPDGMTTHVLTSIFATESRVFVSAADGIFISSNRGLSWHFVDNSALDGNWIHCIASFDSIVMAGTDNGLYRSNDFGLTWTRASNGLPAVEVYSVFVGRGDSFVGLQGNGVYSSTNYGVTWYPLNTGLGNRSVTTMLIEDSVFYAGTTSGVFRSTNKGGQWTTSGLGSRVNCLYRDSLDLYAGTEGSGLYRRHQGSSSWIRVYQGIQSPYITGIVRNGTILCVATKKGIYKLTTIETLDDFNDGLHAVTVEAVAKKENTILASIPVQGIYRSSDNGSSWTNTITGLEPILTRDFFKNSSTWLAGTSLGLLQSDNDGANWIPVQTGINCPIVWNIAANDSFIFAGYCGLFRRRLGSSTWDSLNLGFDGIYALLVIDSTILVGNASGGFPYGIRRSTNQGVDWTTCNTGLGDINITSLAIEANIIFAGTTWAGIHKSLDRGLTWVQCNSGIGGGYRINSLVAGYGFVFAAVADSGVFMSRDQGNSWQSIQAGIPTQWISTLFVGDDTLYAGSSSCGLWKRAVSDFITSTPELKEEPVSYSLSQNYPNPFNPVTTFQFSIVNRQLTILKVYDLLGREVATIVNEILEPGTYQRQFSREGLPSGVYFYRLQAGEFIETRKLLLLK